MHMDPARAVANVCYQQDRRTRFDLFSRSVVSERDYMSTLSTRIRDTWSSFGTASVFSNTLPSGTEQALGCDTLIAIHDSHSAKICLIEAKWPRVATKPAQKWDQLQKRKAKRTGRSHFSDQIQRQRLVVPDAVVAEMFLLECVPGTPSTVLDPFGSTLVIHETAMTFDRSHRDVSIPWSNKDFWELMAYAGKRRCNLGDLVYGLASCQIGNALPISAGSATISTGTVAGTVSIPVDLEPLDQVAPGICERLGVSNFLVLRVEWIG